MRGSSPAWWPRGSAFGTGLPPSGGEIFHNTRSSALRLLALMAAQALVKLLDGEGDGEVGALAHALQAYRLLQVKGGEL